MKVFGKRVRLLRHRKLLTHTQLGMMIGKSRATVQRMESGKVRPGAITLLKLGEVFDVNLLYLLGVRDDPDRGAWLVGDEKTLLALFRELTPANKEGLVHIAGDLMQAQQALLNESAECSRP